MYCIHMYMYSIHQYEGLMYMYMYICRSHTIRLHTCKYTVYNIIINVHVAISHDFQMVLNTCRCIPRCKGSRGYAGGMALRDNSRVHVMLRHYFASPRGARDCMTRRDHA